MDSVLKRISDGIEYYYSDEEIETRISDGDLKFDEDGEISFYFLDIRCALCDSLATAPLPTWDGDDEDDDGYETIDDIFEDGN